jgi:hypothetical protein
MDNGWKWARLDRERLEMIREAEDTLGSDILLAYQPDDQGSVQEESISQMQIQVASLDESQLECLQGLEQKVAAVVVAYQRSAQG